MKEPMHDFIVNYLETTARDRLNNERDEYQKKIGKDKTNNKFKFLDNKLSGNLLFTKFVKYNLTFDDMPLNMVDYLSPYGTFCNRGTFYYDIEKLKDLNDDQKAQVICCEICNVLTNYYVLNTTSTLSPTSQNIRLGRVLAMMHCIGLFNERPNFTSNEQRRYVVRDFNRKYPNAKIIIFPPNIKAAKYLCNLMNFEYSPYLYLNRKQSFTLDVIINDFDFQDWDALDYKALFIRKYTPKSFKFIKDKNGEYKRTNGYSKAFVENEEHINVAKKLAGNQW